MGAQFSQHAADLVGFDGQDEHLGELDNVGIERRRPGGDLFGEGGACGFAGIGGHDLVGGGEPRLDEAFGESGGHLAGARNEIVKWEGMALL